jgi:hypothetical protein
MIAAKAPTLSVLYEQDETAWLELMSGFAAQGRLSEMDFGNLSEYLASMARRDRREVFSRLVVLLVHLLKWEHQPELRTGAWRATILSQHSELRQDLESRSLYNHAVSVLEKAYAEACKQAAAETQLPREAFAAECPWSVDELIADD